MMEYLKCPKSADRTQERPANIPAFSNVSVRGKRHSSVNPNGKTMRTPLYYSWKWNCVFLRSP